jgi:hypothetical protein
MTPSDYLAVIIFFGFPFFAVFSYYRLINILNKYIPWKYWSDIVLVFLLLIVAFASYEGVMSILEGGLE